MILLHFHPTRLVINCSPFPIVPLPRGFGIWIVAYSFAYLWKISNLCITLVDLLIPRIKFTGFWTENMFLIYSLILPAEQCLGLAIGFSESYGTFHIRKMCQPNPYSFKCQEANWLLVDISPTAPARFSQSGATK